MTNGTITVYERWYKLHGEVYVEYYTMDGGEKRVLGQHWTPYKNPPVTIIGDGHFLRTYGVDKT
jgi:hypothetical protein